MNWSACKDNRFLPFIQRIFNGFGNLIAFFCKAQVECHGLPLLWNMPGILLQLIEFFTRLFYHVFGYASQWCNLQP